MLVSRRFSGSTSHLRLIRATNSGKRLPSPRDSTTLLHPFPEELGELVRWWAGEQESSLGSRCYSSESLHAANEVSPTWTTRSMDLIHRLPKPVSNLMQRYRRIRCREPSLSKPTT